ncbi:MAG: hypothetical protein AAFU64_18800, partial [Bacteroidota bacterium]
MIVQAIILTITPPLAGWVTDQMRKKGNNRLPIIQAGISVVSMVFMAVALTVFVNPTGWIKWMLPVLIVLWLISMNIFHSPAISLIEFMGPSARFPQTLAILVIFEDVAYALEPSIMDLTGFLGAPLTFVLGGVLIFVTGWMLKNSLRSLPIARRDPYLQSGNRPSQFFRIILIGLLTGIFSALFFNVFPDLLLNKLEWLKANNWKGSYFVSILIAISALFAWPMSRMVKLWGLSRSLLIAFVALLLLSAIILVSPSDLLTWVAVLAYPIAFSLLSVSALPMIFDSLSSQHKVLGVGIFFGCLGLPN